MEHDKIGDALSLLNGLQLTAGERCKVAEILLISAESGLSKAVEPHLGEGQLDDEPLVWLGSRELIRQCLERLERIQTLTAAELRGEEVGQ